MADPVLIVLVAACVRGLVRLVDVLAHWLALRASIELVRIVAAASPGVEVAGQDRWGGSWRFRSPQSRDEPS